MSWRAVCAAGKVSGVELPVGSAVQVTSGPQRGALGKLVRYADGTRLAYVRIALSASRSALLVVRADAIAPAREDIRARATTRPRQTR